MTTLLILGIATVAASLVAPTSFGAAIIGLAGYFIGVASLLFDKTITLLIVGFDSQIYEAIKPQIGEVWTVFRDIGNIIIIGMFVFIALTMILGVQSFNSKKMVARILLVAILINFSLLFTRVIILSSNFVSNQFYIAMRLDVPAGTANTVESHASSAGIGGQYMALLGLPSAFEARGTLNRIWTANAGYWAKASAAVTGGVVGVSAQGGIVSILYSFASAVLMVSVALVLAYAIFLIVARSVLFIFLIAVSALAFATYLIPGWGPRYWKMWWQSLLSNAVFGPLLMMMLWATLIVSYAFVQNGPGKNRTFDKLFEEPTNDYGIMALITFLVILGMLFASIRFASKFATKIGGFDYASMVPGFAFAQLGRAGGFLGRTGIGLPSAQASYLLAKGAKSFDKPDASATERRFARMLDFGAQAFKAPAKRDFNAANLFGKDLARLGLKGGLAGQTKFGGQIGRDDALAKRKLEQSERTTKTEKEIRDEAYKEADSKHTDAKKMLEETHQETEKQIATLTSSIQTMSQNKDAAQKELNALEKQRLQVASDGNLSGSEKKSRIDEIEIAKAQRQSAITEQTEHINQAKLDANELTVRSRDNRIALQRKIVESANELIEQKTGGKSFQERVTDKASNAVLNRPTNWPLAAMGISTVDNDRVASQMRKTASEMESEKALKKLIGLTEKGLKQDQRAYDLETIGRREEKKDRGEMKSELKEIASKPSIPMPKLEDRDKAA